MLILTLEAHLRSCKCRRPQPKRALLAVDSNFVLAPRQGWPRAERADSRRCAISVLPPHRALPAEGPQSLTVADSGGIQSRDRADQERRHIRVPSTAWRRDWFRPRASNRRVKGPEDRELRKRGSILCSGPDKVPALRTVDRPMVREPRPRSGAVLVLWLARAANANVAAETILNSRRRQGGTVLAGAGVAYRPG
jgi:hypothetical protein